MNNNTLSVGDGVEVSQSEFNISSEESGKSFYTVTSNLSVTAAKSSHVDCLASVSALPTPLKSSVRLTVGETVTQPSYVLLNNMHTHTQSRLSSLILLWPSVVLCVLFLSLHFFVSFCSLPFWEACESSLNIIIEEDSETESSCQSNTA